jgi:hypothetical protein
MKRLPGLALVLGTLTAAAAAGESRGQSPPSAGWSDLVPRVEGARHHYVSTGGRTDNPGTPASPWDLASALGGGQSVAPGDVIWVRGGMYKGQHELKLAGKHGAPIHVRAYPGERATLTDGTLLVRPPASHVWVWDLEITSSTPPESRVIRESGSHPEALPNSFVQGVNTLHTDGFTYKGLKFIDLVVHDTREGLELWVEAVDTEVHGCLIYDNGWNAPDRGHGHCIYAQNRAGVKTVSGCIMSAKYEGAYTVHAYGSSRAFVDNFVVEDNIADRRGPILVGGGRPSHNIKVLRNYLYGVGLRVGYGAQNEDCEIRGNVVARGSLEIDRFKKAAEAGNVRELPARKAVLIANKYDPTRAHLAVFNGAKAPEVPVDVTAFLKPGDSFRLLDPKDVFGRPVLAGRYQRGTLSVPVKDEFAAFVILKD